jgi:hypothetical protein
LLRGTSVEANSFAVVSRQAAASHLIKESESNFSDLVALIGSEPIKTCRLPIVLSHSATTVLVEAAEIELARSLASVGGEPVVANGFDVVLRQARPPAFVEEPDGTVS